MNSGQELGVKLTLTYPVIGLGTTEVTDNSNGVGGDVVDESGPITLINLGQLNGTFGTINDNFATVANRVNDISQWQAEVNACLAMIFKSLDRAGMLR